MFNGSHPEEKSCLGPPRKIFRVGGIRAKEKTTKVDLDLWSTFQGHDFKVVPLTTTTTTITLTVL